MPTTQSINNNEEKLLNMILGKTPISRIAIIYDHDADIMWNSVRDNSN